MDPCKWLRANGADTAPLTGQDRRALLAIAACWELVAFGDAGGERAAYRSVLSLLTAMQMKCWPLARQLIARSLDWTDIERIWPDIKTPVLRCGHSRGEFTMPEL